ncbi:response regulator [Butyricicoccus sp. AF15-40]|nr:MULTISPECIES: ATP-binding protein [unclassified Butyricicoccus]RGM77770.1 response regulator [Butyricicoccus sp. OM06-6AC]RHQ72376.1 response regulator [Butyricicoccus sp. AF24-19AC]RHR86650.1 response regulator [Butyricicoccus sp. AF15-40]
MLQIKKNKATRRYERIAAAIGAVLVIVVGFNTVRAESAQTREQLGNTIDYVKEQCTTYTRYNAASVTKSLMRIMDNAQQVNRNIGYEGSTVDEERLRFYAQEQRLTGIILLDTDGRVQCEYNGDLLNFLTLQEYIERDTVLDVVRYPQKTYASRIDLPDGSYVDISAYGRTDVPGVIVAYYHTTAEYARNYTLTIQGSLAGYNTRDDGVIVVADGDRIIASNDEALADTKVEDSRILQQIKSNLSSAEVGYFKCDGGTYFGGLDRSRDYYIYAYVSDRMVATDMVKNMMAALIIYLIMLTAIQMFRRRSAREYLAEQDRREREFRGQLMESAEKAEQANRAKTEFLQRMSHDIRTPINGIRGMIEIANYYKDDPDKQTECRKKIWDASGLLLELVNEVLDMGKLESGEIMLEEREFDLKELLDSVGVVVDKQARERGITIITDSYPVEHRYLLGSPLHLRRLLMNIISNAVKYNHAGGEVRLGCREKPSADPETAQIEFTCADTGIGMSEEFQKHVFEPFAQERNFARSEYGGTGLGMPIAKSLAEKMGGTLSFVSRQGVGTTFTLSLPFRICHAPEKRNKPKRLLQTSSIAGLHVLVAEDNRMNMEIAEFVLNVEEAFIIKAVNGEEAVRIFADSRPGEIDAILMDVMMPVMDGLEATRRIRAMKRPDARTIPIIAMTANAFAEDRQLAFAAGMDMHIAKPLEGSEMVETLERLVKSSRK